MKSWLRKALGITKQPEGELLATESQRLIATEEALTVAVEIVYFQKNLMLHIIEAVEETGMTIGASPEVDETMTALFTRMNACMRVVGESIGIDPATIEALFKDIGKVPE